MEWLAAATDLFSGADVHAVCNRAGLNAIRDAIVQSDSAAPDRPAKVQITRAHIEQALEGVQAQHGED